MLKARGTYGQLAIHSLAAILLTFLTGVFGSPFLRVMHKQSKVRFWLTGLFITICFWLLQTEPLAILMGSLWTTIGLYSEFEDLGWGWVRSSLISLFTGTVLGLAGFRKVLSASGITSWDAFVKLVQDKMELVLPVQSSMKPDAEILAQQAPSAWLIFLVLCLGTALIFEGRLFAWLGLSRERVASRLRLLEFRLPDAMIWVALTAFLVTMVNFGSQPLSVLGANVVNVMVVLYFFQGLAVMEVLLRSLRAGAFIRAAVYVIVVGQLFFVLSAVGLIDYWIDFRARLRKTGAPAGPDTKFGGSV